MVLEELKELLVGKKPESMSYDKLISEIKTNRVLLLICCFLFILILLGVRQQHGEILSCWNGDVLQACRTALDNCNFGFKENLFFNLS